MNEDVRGLSQSATTKAVAGGGSRAPYAKGPDTLCFIVDDEAGIRNVIARLLQSLSIASKEFSDAASAIKALSDHTPSLIFLDVSLEGSDAIEVIRGLEQHRFRGTVQLMSGRDATLLEEVKRVGKRHSLRMLPVLQKPFRAETIRGVIAQMGMVPHVSVTKQTPSQPSVDLDEALRAGWVELWYQPKIDLRTMRLAGAEGLVRIWHPEHGLVLPAAFMPKAADATLLALTEQVLEIALRDWPEFAEAGGAVPLAVNVPMNALTALPIAALVREKRPKSANWPGLILEITEDQIVRDIPLAHEIATQLKIYNIHLAIDDFGAGYSSLARLKELPFTELKLDRSFVSGCDSDDTNANLCQTVIAIAHRFGSQAIAEGIETPQELKALQQMGCDVGQGFLLGRPMPKAQLVSVLQQRALAHAQVS